MVKAKRKQLIEVNPSRKRKEKYYQKSPKDKEVAGSPRFMITIGTQNFMVSCCSHRSDFMTNFYGVCSAHQRVC